MSTGADPIPVNVLGFGCMGRQIAALLHSLGFHVHVWTRGETADRISAFNAVKRAVEKRVQWGGPAGSLSFVVRTEDLLPGPTFEVLIEDLEAKRSAVKSLPYDPLSHTLFTNTSSYRPDEILPGAIGFHFFNPLFLLKFAEITAAPDEIPAHAGIIAQRIGAAGFEIIRTRSNRGYIGNTILFSEISATLRLMDEHGYESATIDRVQRHMGREASLFDIIDIIGVDVVHRILINLREADPGIHVSPRLQQALDQGVRGRANRTSIRQVYDLKQDGG